MNSKLKVSIERKNYGGFLVKGKILVILSTVAVLHLFVGGLVLTGGCETVEDDPMPPGAYVPTPAPDVAQPDINAVSQNEEETIVYVQEPDDVITLSNETEPVVSTEVSEPSQEEPQAKPVEVKAPAVDSEAELMKYTVQRGDTLSGIALAYGVKVNALASYNKIAKKDFIRVGQVLTIPPGGKAVPSEVKRSGGRVSSSLAKTGRGTAVKKTGSSSRKAVMPIPADGIYVVQKNDSFYKIGAKFGVKAADIAAVNNLPLEKPLQIGQKLTIPQPGAVKKALPAETVKSNASSAVETKASTSAENTSAASQNGSSSDLTSPDALMQEIPLPDEGTIVPTSAPAASSSDDAAAAGGAVGAAVGSSSANAAEASSAAVSEEEEASTHFSVTLEEDSTLAKVAEKYFCSLEDLRKLNPQLPENGTIRAGTVIKMPLL